VIKAVDAKITCLHSAILKCKQKLIKKSNYFAQTAEGNVIYNVETHVCDADWLNACTASHNRADAKAHTRQGGQTDVLSSLNPSRTTFILLLSSCYIVMSIGQCA
jgi:hypothetical protein